MKIVKLSEIENLILREVAFYRCKNDGLLRLSWRKNKITTTEATTATLAPTTTIITTAENTTTAASKPSILVMDNKSFGSGWKQSFMANFNGKQIWSTNLLTGNYLGNVNNLTLDRLQPELQWWRPDGSCGAIMNGIYWLIGGYSSLTKVRSKLP